MADITLADDEQDTEEGFQQGIRATPWFREYVEKEGEEPDLETPNYDYRRAWRAGVRPDVRDSNDQLLHWPSEFKGPSHPNRYVEGVDTTLSPEQRAEALEGAGARKLARGQLRRTPEGMESLPVVSDEETYDAVEAGKKFRDPQGNVRTKNYTVTDETDYAAVPEGAQYSDPQGNLRTKPAYQDVSFTAHTLYNMAVNDTERRNALKRSYPDATIEQSPDGDFFVRETDGTLRRPRRAADPKAGPLQTGALIASGAAPTAGAIAGEIAGGVIGALPTLGVGALPGAIAGAGVGSALGQTFNDLFLKWAGVYDRSVGEQLAETGLAAGFGAGGTAVGRGAAAAYPWVKGKIGTGAPGAVAGALGAEREALETSLRLGQEGEQESSSRILRSWGMTDPGTKTPISSWAKETPMIHIEQEVLHPTFFTQEPLQAAKAAKMESGGKQILGDLGASVEGSLVEPVAAVSGREAGQKLIDRAIAQSAAAEERLAAEIAGRRATAEAGMAAEMPEHEARMASLRQAARVADDAATRVVDAGYQEIGRDVENAMRAARAGHNSGDFWTSVADKFREIRQAISGRATHRYGQWEQMHGAIVPEQEGLAAAAREFIDDIPQPFRDTRPTLVRKLARLAGEETAEEGAEEIAPATLAELHDIRSLFRAGADWSDLASDVKNGSMKRFAQMLDGVMHGGRNATPELRAAARDLDVIDAWYAKVMPVFNDHRVQAIVDGLKNGQPADPKAVVDLMIRENNTDLNNKLRRMLGPNLWAGIRGSHADALVRRNQTLAGTVDGAAFARDVLADHNSGLLRSIHGEEGAARLFRQAQLAAALEGKLDVAVRPGDTVMDVIAASRAAARSVQEEAERNPLALLKKEMNRLKQQEQADIKGARAETAKDPLRFLYNRSTGAAEAVDKILKKEDLVIAVEARFGRNSDEFRALQQVGAQRVLTGTLDPGSRLANISPEVQEMLFGVKLADAQLLARDMEFLVGGREAGGTGSSILATSKVTHPWASILGRGGSVAKLLTSPLRIIPGSDYAGRTLLGAYYDLKVKMLESPSFQRWVLKGLQGDDRAREMVRETVQRWSQRGGAVGAGIGEAGYQRERVSEPPLESVQ